MSAIHIGSVAARLRKDGLYEYTGTSEDHAVTGWPETGADQDMRALIPAQRAGSAYEQVLLDPADGLADLSDLVPIPSMRPFALDWLRDNPDETETQP